MTPGDNLKPEEHQVIETLAAAWNEFLTLPTLHPNEQQEFMHAIHDAQRIVIARGFIRSQNKKKKPKS